MKLILALMTLISLTAFAQFEKDFPVILKHNGGNGGDDYEIMIKSNLMHISHFLNSETGQILFKKDLDPKIFTQTVKSVDIRIVDTELIDKFGAQRCALNFPEDLLIAFKRSCIEELKNRPRDFLVLISHEILNVMGLELPDERGGSIYPISTRIGEMSGVIQKENKDIILSQTCDLDISLSIQEIDLPDMGKTILKDKGYKKINFGAFRRFDKRNVRLDLSLLSMKMDQLTVEGNKVIIEGTKYEVDHTLMSTKFDGFLVGNLQKGSHYLFTPVKLGVKKMIITGLDNPTDHVQWARDLWKPTGTGKHFSLFLKRGYKASFMESLLKMPSCVSF